MRCMLLSLFLLAGCVAGRMADGEPYVRSAVDALEPGKTTAAEVTELLGPPRMVVELDKRSAYLYESSQTRVAGLLFLVVNFVNVDRRFDRVWVFFDENGVLTHHGAKLSAHRARMAMPWKDLDKPERNARRDAERAEKERRNAAATEPAQEDAS